MAEGGVKGTRKVAGVLPKNAQHLLNNAEITLVFHVVNQLSVVILSGVSLGRYSHKSLHILQKKARLNQGWAFRL